MTTAQTIGFVAIAIAVGGAGGWVAKSRVVGEPGDSPVRVVGGSITARDHKGWQSVSGCASSPCYQSKTQVPLGKMTVEMTQGPTSTSLSNDWMAEVFDRNEFGPGTNGIKVCSQKTCNTSGSISSTQQGSVYLMLDGDSEFYQIPAPQDNTSNDSSSDAGLRFHDVDNCGMLNGLPVDQDYCERIGSIRITSAGATVSSLSGNCDDGACKIHFGK